MKYDIKAIFAQYKISSTRQRLKIYEYLLTHRTHPSAEDIFHGLADNKKSLSLATVYNTLKLFEEKNLVLAISLKNGKTYYDAFLHPHAHLYSPSNDQIIDIDMDYAPLLKQLPEGVDINSVNVLIYGEYEPVKKQN